MSIYPTEASSSADFRAADCAYFDSVSSWEGLDAAQRGQPGNIRVAVLTLGDRRLRDGGDGALISRVLAWFGRPDLVSIAVMSGSIDAADLALALACDVRVAAALSIDVGPTVQPGLVDPLVELVGHGQAAVLLLAGRPLDATEAVRIGLLTHELAAGDDFVSTLIAEVVQSRRDLIIERKALLLGARRPAEGRAVFAAEVAARDRLARDAAGSAG